MLVQPGAPQPQFQQLAEIAELYYVLHLRSLSNPLFLNRTLRSFRPGARRRRHQLCLSDLLPIKLCQLTSGKANVRKRLTMLVRDIQSEHHRFQRLACFLVKSEKLIDSAQYLLPKGNVPGAVCFLPFDYDFLLSPYHEKDWIIIGYVYHEGETEPQAAFELDLGHLFKNFYRRLSDIMIDVALEHPIHENEVGRMQLQLSWWYSPYESDTKIVDAASPEQGLITDELTFKYSWRGGKERHCETKLWARTSRCPFCFSICPNVDSLVLHLCLSHDRLDVRYHASTVYIEPVEECDSIEPCETMLILGGLQLCRSLTGRILQDHRQSARQAGAHVDRKRRKTVAKSVQSAQTSLPSSKLSAKRSSKLNGKVSCSKKKEKPLKRSIFYHGSSFVPVKVGSFLEGYKDSDMDIEDSWITLQQNQTIAMFEDVENDDKELMILWNETRKRESTIFGDKDMVPFCMKFAFLIRERNVCLRKPLLNHLLVLWEFGLLSSLDLKKVIDVYDGRDQLHCEEKTSRVI